MKMGRAGACVSSPSLRLTTYLAHCRGFCWHQQGDRALYGGSREVLHRAPTLVGVPGPLRFGTAPLADGPPNKRMRYDGDGPMGGKPGLKIKLKLKVGPLGVPLYSGKLARWMLRG